MFSFFICFLKKLFNLYHVHLLVRASVNRGVDSEEGKLFATMEALPKKGTITIKLSKTPVRKPRQATLTIKYTEVTLKSPNVGKGRAKGRASLFRVQAKEEHPNDSCTKILSKLEWQALVGVTQPKKKQDMVNPPIIQEAVRMLASLGGFLQRKGDGDPGVKALWIGLRRFHDMAFVWRLIKRVDEDVGKGIAPKWVG